MPRTLSSRTQTEIAKTVTKPFWLIYIGYGTPLRKSSGATVTWNGQTWNADDIQVTVNPDRNTGTLKIQNTDYVFGGKVLTDNISDIPIKIYELYGDPPYAVADAEILFDGVGDVADDINPRWAVIKLAIASTKDMFSPRIRCTKEIGFNHLPVGKMVISLNGEQYTLEVSDSG